MTNLKEIFADKKVFIPYVVADDPDIETTVQSVLTLAQNGADVVEIGIPFSDPVADGPVIQKADLRAFSAGVKTDVIFEIVEKVRQSSTVPIVLVTYLNIPFKYGYERFCQKCRDLQITGLFIPDAPIEEQVELKLIAQKYDVDLIPIIFPTSADRVEMVAESATAFIYVVSILGMAGVSNKQAIQQLDETIQRIRKVTTAPVVAFGVSAPEQVEKLAPLVDGINIDSSIVQIIADGGDVQNNLAKYAHGVRDAFNVKI